MDSGTGLIAQAADEFASQTEQEGFRPRLFTAPSGAESVCGELGVVLGTATRPGSVPVISRSNVKSLF